MPQSKPQVLIPEGYIRIAATELRHSKAEAYYNRSQRKLFFVVDGTLPLGPFTRAQLEALLHVGRDVMEMKNVVPI